MTEQQPDHPALAIAKALGTETHKLDAAALAEYRAGHPRKAEQAQAAAIGADTSRSAGKAAAAMGEVAKAATSDPSAEAAEQGA